MAISEAASALPARGLPAGPLLQIAGVIDQAEADLLVSLGVPLLGFPLRLPVHREDLTEAAAGRIIRGLPPGVAGVVITYLHRADEILELCHATGARVVQLHGDIGVEELRLLKLRDPGLAIIKSLVVRGDNRESLLESLARLSPLADAFITDTFDPLTGASGATGKTHDWRVSRELALASPKPVILAGGLTADNVREAIRSVRPAGVDAHTGVEDARGRKDPDKVRRFVAGAHAAFSLLP